MAVWFQITTNNNSLLTFEQFYLTHRWDPNKYYQSGSE